MEFKERVAKLRKYRGLTQKQVAERSGLTVRGVQNYEITDRQPKGEFLSKLAKGLNVPVSALLSDEGFEQFMLKQKKKNISNIMSSNNCTNSKKTAMAGVMSALSTNTYYLPTTTLKGALTTSALGGALTLAIGAALPLTITSLIGIGGINAVRSAINKSKHIENVLKELYKEISRLEGLIVIINDKLLYVRNEYQQLAIKAQQEDADVADYQAFIQLSRLISAYQDYHNLLVQKSKYCSLLAKEIETHSAKKTEVIDAFLKEISNIEKQEHEIADVIMKTGKELSSID